MKEKENQKHKDLPLFFWDSKSELGFDNFGDVLSRKLVERIIGRPVKVITSRSIPEKKLLAASSTIHCANDGDVVWGAGINIYNTALAFSTLDVRAVRGPLTERILEGMGIYCPPVYGDPALLTPYLFREFQKPTKPSRKYCIVPHFYDEKTFLSDPHLVSVKEPWDIVIQKILDSEFVISTSLHGLIVAEAYGISARLLRISEKEHLFKFHDYYIATGRPDFCSAHSVKEALQMGGEKPFECDLELLYNAFPFDCFSNKNLV